LNDYEFLTTKNIPDYIRENPELSAEVDADRLRSIEEIGDGNLNLVFLIKDEDGNGLCLKQALPYVRMTGEGWPLTPERARFEAQSLLLHAGLSPETGVRVFTFNPERHIIAMEDLSDHSVWRGALNDGELHEGAAGLIGRYVARVAFGTSAIGMDRTELAKQQEASVNPELCVITEDLVFTEPSVDAGRNSTIAANAADAKDLADDTAFVNAMGLAKWKFMTDAEALIHGDLHTGSIMVRKSAAGEVDSVKAFDSEFAFYGPVAFDLGLLWANFIYAAARAVAKGEDERAAWLVQQIGESWEAFQDEFLALWPRRQDPRVWSDAQLRWLLDHWKNDGWLFAAAELARRAVGAAKNSDVETLDEQLREGAIRGILRVARAAARSYEEGGPTAEDTLNTLREHATR
jgi:5-methylthioribose kinase